VLSQPVFSFERLRQRCEFAVFESEKQPLFDWSWSFQFLLTRGDHAAQTATAILGGYFFAVLETLPTAPLSPLKSSLSQLPTTRAS